MQTIRRFLRLLCADEEGVAAIEYALLGALIALVIATGAALVGSELEQLFTEMANKVVDAIKH